jgi:phage tail sheath protein FI
MILIRRVLVPLAESFVFEPNNRVLYRAVEREIGGLLTDLFERGAFAGGTPDASFRVRVASTAEDVDAGRFVVEIQVAPALPLEFMTIRLVQGSIQRIEEI